MRGVSTSEASRRRSVALTAVALSVAGVLIVLGSGLGRDVEARPDALLGRPAPSLEHLVSLGSEGPPPSGDVVVVNFFASWCAACVQEHAALDSVWRTYGGAPVTVLGVAFEDGAGAVRSFQLRLGVDWALALDPSGETAIDFGVAGVPETFVIGLDGRIRRHFVGPVEEASLGSAVGEALRAGIAR